jgi:hypothetical protein
LTVPRGWRIAYRAEDEGTVTPDRHLVEAEQVVVPVLDPHVRYAVHLAGEVELFGNVLIQGRTVGAVSGTLEDLRGLIARTQDLARYEPRA